MNEISFEFPDYLRTPYSVPNCKVLPHSRKLLKSPLTQGVSSEAPDFFKVPKACVVSPEFRKDLLEPKGGRFLSDLKKNKVTGTKMFEYSDIQESKYDYDSVSFFDRISLKNDKNPRLKKSGGFFSKYKKDLEKGFGKSRGEFTVERTNPKVTRNHPTQAKTLEQILRKTTRSNFFSKESKLNTDKKVLTGVAFLVKKETVKEEENPLTELEVFESRLPKSQSLAVRRKIYSINEI